MLNLIKTMVLSCAMLAVTACNTNTIDVAHEENSFVKGVDAYGTHITAFCFSSTKVKCIAYMDLHCRNAQISSTSESSGEPTLTTVFATCQE